MPLQKPTSPIKASTQQFVEIDYVADDVLALKDGSCVLIVEVAAVNFWLLAQEEQESMIGAFGSFLNSLSFPVQILILSKRMNISSYVEKIHARIEEAQNPFVKNLLQRYATFINTIVKKNTILEKRFFCVIPFSPMELGPSGLNVKHLNKDYVITRAKTSLYPKRDHLLRILSRAGLTGRVLMEQEIAELFYNLYNPTNSGRKLAPIKEYTQVIHSP